MRYLLLIFTDALILLERWIREDSSIEILGCDKVNCGTKPHRKHCPVRMATHTMLNGGTIRVPPDSYVPLMSRLKKIAKLKKEELVKRPFYLDKSVIVHPLLKRYDMLSEQITTKAAALGEEPVNRKKGGDIESIPFPLHFDFDMVCQTLPSKNDLEKMVKHIIEDFRVVARTIYDDIEETTMKYIAGSCEKPQHDLIEESTRPTVERKISTNEKGRTVVTWVDSETGEVLRRPPPKEEKAVICDYKVGLHGHFPNWFVKPHLARYLRKEVLDRMRITHNFTEDTLYEVEITNDFDKYNFLSPSHLITTESLTMASMEFL